MVAAVVVAITKNCLLLLAALWLVVPVHSAEAQESSSAGKTLVLPRTRTNALLEVGIKCLKESKYEKALECFQASLKHDSSNAYAYYFSAICYRELGDRERALSYLRLTASRFPSEEVGKLARTTLNEISRLTASNQAAIVWPGTGSLPRETWIPFRRQGSGMYVDGSFEGHSCSFLVDTGAEVCFLPLKLLKRLGLTAPSGKPNSLLYGVGGANALPAWVFKGRLKVGSIEKTSFPIMVADVGVNTAILGQQFFEGYAYRVDTAGSAIVLARKDLLAKADSSKAPVTTASMVVDKSGRYVYQVPFKRSGRSFIVAVQVNGRSLDFVFDTGAEVSLINATMAKQLGLSVQQVSGAVMSGVVGSTPVGVSQVDLKLGPIERSGMPVAITDAVQSGTCLLGRDFLGDWHFEIDESQGLIKFTRY